MYTRRKLSVVLRKRVYRSVPGCGSSLEASVTFLFSLVCLPDCKGSSASFAASKPGWSDGSEEPPWLPGPSTSCLAEAFPGPDASPDLSLSTSSLPDGPGPPSSSLACSPRAPAPASGLQPPASPGPGHQQLRALPVTFTPWGHRGARGWRPQHLHRAACLPT